MFRAKTNWIVNLGPTEMVRGDQKDFKLVSGGLPFYLLPSTKLR
jgi:hypothetical protein